MSNLTNTELRLQLLEQKYARLVLQFIDIADKIDAMVAETSQIVAENKERVAKSLLFASLLGLKCEDPNCECKKQKTKDGEQTTGDETISDKIGTVTFTNVEGKTTKDNSKTNESGSGTKIE